MAEKAAYDMTSIGVVAVIAIVCVVLMVFGLKPGQTSAQTAAQDTLGKAASYGDAAVPVGQQFDVTLLDFNEDGIVDFYDYEDVLSGKADCTRHTCDLNDDGLLDNRDAESFRLMVTRLYDYDNDRQLTRADPLFLKDILAGTASCDTDHICDLDGDGFVTSQDLALYTSLIYNYDFARS